MSALKSVLLRIGHYFLSFIRSLRKMICCRRKKEVEYVLPMTVGDVMEVEQTQEAMFENLELKSHWEAWPDITKSNNLNSQYVRTNSEDSQTNLTEYDGQDDYFKDMVPQIRKQKKIFVRTGGNSSEKETSPPNRLAMDTSRIIMTPDLGVIDDNPCNWENSEDSDQVWDPDALIRENKRIEQEKRRIEHQRKKQEKEIKRASKPESLSSMMSSLSESKDKHKYS